MPTRADAPDEQELASADEPPAPVAFGKYRIHRRIARGGMGEVFLASLVGELGFEKRLVVKTILPELASKPRFVELFAAEAKTAVALSHGNIVPIYELGRADDTLYIVMGHVDGPSLERMLATYRALGKPPPLSIALHIIREMLDGLAYAHTEEPGRPAVVHRDITPRNVLLDRSGQVRLVDFGVAMPVNVAVDVRAGSTGYVAPEQARATVADPRADVFSVGCIAYELLTLSRAFPKEGVWTPPDLRDVPEALRPILDDAMAVEIERRPAHAGALLARLSPIVAAHAAAMSHRDLGEHLRELFPEGWDPSASTSMRVDFTPVTRVSPQTYATRLTAVTPVQIADDEPSASSDDQLVPPAASAAVPSRIGARPIALLGVLLAVVGVAVVMSFDRDDAPASSRAPAVAPATEHAREGERADASGRTSDRESADASGRASDRERGDANDRDRIAEADRPTAAPPGVYSLVVEPADAEVVVDGAIVPGPAPYVIDLPPAGTKSVVVRRSGYVAQSLELTPESIGELTVALTRESGKGSVQIVAPRVPWAEVRIDGKRRGTTPTPSIDLPAGTHRIVVRCIPDACDPERTLLSKTVTITAGETKKLTAE